MGQVLEVKHSGYDWLLQQVWFQKSETGGQALIRQAENQLKAARAYGMKNLWVIKGQPTADAIRSWFIENEVPVGLGGIEFEVVP